jgi:hypothetical protein
MVRPIAFYLPQFHPIPENDAQWGEGFTEWTNVKKARPLYPGHYQPFVPAQLGYYDLRDAAARQAQAHLARQYGIEGFCYWHYWFAGKRVLDLPFNQVLASGQPDFPFCLCWANHSWTATWVGDTKKVLMEQTYPGLADFTNHFYALLPAFTDRRYIRVAGKLLFGVFNPRGLETNLFTNTWRALAQKEGLGDFHFFGMGIRTPEMNRLGFDAYTSSAPHDLINQLRPTFFDKISYKLAGKNFAQLQAKWLHRPTRYAYSKIVSVAFSKQFEEHEYPVAAPNWDHSPRSKNRAIVFDNPDPKHFGAMLRHYAAALQNRPYQKRILLLKAWNEWAEGNFLEPEARYGLGYLEEIKKVSQAGSSGGHTAMWYK